MARRTNRMGSWPALVLAVSLASAGLARAQDQRPAAEPPDSTFERTPAGESESAEPWSSGRSSTPSLALAGDEPDYRIGAADVLRVLVWRNPELSADVPVRPDGRISVPLLGDVRAEGLTTAELKERISAGLSEYITAPDVTVTVTQVNSKIVFVVGEVLRPSPVSLNREMRVLDAIAVAGGFSPFANKGRVKVLRPRADGSVEEHRFDYGRFVKGKAPDANLVLHPGDTIVVPD